MLLPGLFKLSELSEQEQPVVLLELEPVERELSPAELVPAGPVLVLILELNLELFNNITFLYKSLCLLRISNTNLSSLIGNGACVSTNIRA